jgi:hypothetical protein
MGDSTRDIDFALAGGGLSGPEKERILAKVLAQLARRSWWRGRLALALGGGLSLAAVSAVVLLVATPGAQHASRFTARGQTVAAAADLEVDCLGASLTACPSGATLLFAVRGGARRGYLAAWATPVAGGERIWYFSQDSEAPLVEPTDVRAVAIPRGVRIGPEHAPGVYLIHVVLADEPLARAALLAEPPAAAQVRERFLLTVVAP